MSVGDKAVKAEDQTTSCDDEEPASRRNKARYAQRKREKHKEYNYIPIATITTKNNNQPLLKVTRSLYIVTNLGQLPFMLFTQMARTWAIQRDSVNTSIIHLYSTM